MKARHYWMVAERSNLYMGVQNMFTYRTQKGRPYSIESKILISKACISYCKWLRSAIITQNSVPGTTLSGSLSGIKRAENSCQDLATVLIPLFQVPPGNNAANNYRLRVEGFSKVTGNLFLYLHSGAITKFML